MGDTSRLFATCVGVRVGVLYTCSRLLPAVVARRVLIALVVLVFTTPDAAAVEETVVAGRLVFIFN